MKEAFSPLVKGIADLIISSHGRQFVYRFIDMKDMPTVEAENPQCPEDDDADMFLSPGLVQRRRRRRKSLLVLILVLAFAVVVIIVLVTVIFRPNLKSAESQQEPPETTTAKPSSVSLSTNCPPPSTKSSDRQFLLEGFQISGCHRMECLSDRILQNTRDRLSHSAPLCKGQALCNNDDEKFPGVLFQFGLTPNGALVWQKCDPSDPSRTEIITLRESELNNELHNNTNNTPPSSAAMASSQKQQLWFEMRPDATWQILSTTGQENSTTTTTTTATATATTTLVFEQPVQNQPRPVGVALKCLSDSPVMDCPYIHFRRHGDIVMNYIDTQDGWVACKSRKICYSSLWE